MDINSHHHNLFGNQNFVQIGGSLLRIDIHRWFAMVGILNPKWPPKYKNPSIWKKFDFQVDYDVAGIVNLGNL
jgi:hypothetical protein